MPGGHPSYRANQSKAMGRTGDGFRFYADATLCCAYCGRYTGNGTLYVFLTCLGEFSESEYHTDAMDFLGMYPVGSDCAKKLKAAGVPIYKVTNPGEALSTFKRL
jgi:hypothetical protein